MSSISAALPQVSRPQLFVKDVIGSTTDAEIMDALAVHNCLRARPVIDRSAGPYSPAAGYIEFEHMAKGKLVPPGLCCSRSAAEKAYALVQSHAILGRDCTLSLSVNQPPTEDAVPDLPGSKLIIRQLPRTLSRAELYDIARPHGPIFRCALQNEVRGTSTGIGIVHFYEPAHAQSALETLHLTTVGAGPGAVQILCEILTADHSPVAGLPGTHAGSKAWTDAPAFIPRAPPTASVGISPNGPPQQPQPRRPHSNSLTGILGPPITQSLPLTTAPPNVAAAWRHAPPTLPGGGANPVGLGLGMPGGLVNVSLPSLPQPPLQAPLVLHNTGSNAPVDPCNLFIKNLEPSVASQDLFGAFKAFGRIVSARVMRDERTGLSREFGFVSFSTAQEAAQARQAMDGAILLGSSGMGKEAVVRFHEPKNKRDSRGSRLSSGGIVYPIEQGIPIQQLGTPMSQYEASPPSGLGSAPISRNVSSSSSSASPPHATVGLPATEADRIMLAIRREVPDARRHQQLADLVMTLPKKERALCLFNVEVLRHKLAEANDVLDALDEDGETDVVAAVRAARTSSLKHAAVNAAEPKQLPTPSATPRNSWTATDAPLPHVPAGGWTLAKLARLDAIDIIRLAAGPSPPPELAKPDAHVVAAQDSLVDSLLNLSANDQKQRLGERLFKVLKGFNVPKASTKTIELLDTEDLRALCHLMVEQPEVLREKAMPSYA